MTSTFWKLWQDRLEEAEDKRFQPLGDMALAKHRCYNFKIMFSLGYNQLSLKVTHWAFNFFML